MTSSNAERYRTLGRQFFIRRDVIYDGSNTSSSIALSFPNFTVPDNSRSRPGTPGVRISRATVGTFADDNVDGRRNVYLNCCRSAECRARWPANKAPPAPLCPTKGHQIPFPVCVRHSHSTRPAFCKGNSPVYFGQKYQTELVVTAESWTLARPF